MADGTNERALARSVWKALEPLHTIVYFAPEADPTYSSIGIQGPYMQYFASRAAAMGAVPPEVVTATFYGFHPRVVAQGIPQAWSIASVDEILAARLAVADAAIKRQYSEWIGSPEIKEAAELAREAVEGCDVQGRALFAGHAAQTWPNEEHLSLWWAATLIREHRGDGHIACLVREGIGPCESIVLHDASGQAPNGFLKATRGWTDEEWSKTQQSLTARGMLESDGSLSASGRELRNHVEDATDERATGPISVLGVDAATRLCELAEGLPKGRSPMTDKR